MAKKDKMKRVLKNCILMMTFFVGRRAEKGLQDVIEGWGRLG